MPLLCCQRWMSWLPSTECTSRRQNTHRCSDGQVSEINTWWRHQMETFSALLAICAGNSPASGEFPAQRSVTRSLDVFFDLCPNKRMRKQSWGWWFETLSRPLWRHFNDIEAETKWPLFRRRVSDASSWMKSCEFQMIFNWNVFLMV